MTDDAAYVSEPIRAQMQRMAVEILDANAKLNAVQAACQRYGCCVNGYDPGESCGCLLCEVTAALAGQDRDTAAAAEVCACGHDEASHRDHRGEWTCCTPAYRCGCLAFWAPQRAAVRETGGEP